MAKRLFGIDIGTESVKIAEVKKNNNNFILTRGEVLPFDRLEQISQLLRDFLKKETLSSAVANVAIPAQSAFVRMVRFPIKINQKLSQVMKYEIQQQVPFPLEEIVWGYQVCATIGQEIFVLLIAIKKNLLDEYVVMVEKAGFEISAITLSTAAIYNLFKNLKLAEEETLILDIGHRVTDLIIADKDIFWSRTLPLGGVDMEETLSRELGVDAAAARNIKKERSVVLTMYYGKEETHLSEEQKISQAISSVLFDICTEVLQSIAYYRGHYNKEITFKQVFIVGGGSLINNIDTFLQSNLNLPVLKAGLEKYFPGPGKAEDAAINIMVPAISMSCAAEVSPAINIDLLPDELLQAKQWRKRMPLLVTALVIFALMFGQLLVYFSVKNMEQGKTLAVLNDYNLRLKKQMPSLKDKSNEIVFLKARLDFLGDIAKAKLVALETVDELAKALPKTVWLEHLDFRKDNRLFLLNGVSNNGFAGLAQFKENLEKSGFFEQIKITQAFQEGSVARFSAEAVSKKWHFLRED